MVEQEEVKVREYEVESGDEPEGENVHGYEEESDLECREEKDGECEREGVRTNDNSRVHACEVAKVCGRSFREHEESEVDNDGRRD